MNMYIRERKVVSFILNAHYTNQLICTAAAGAKLERLGRGGEEGEEEKRKEKENTTPECLPFWRPMQMEQDQTQKGNNEGNLK